MSVLLWIAVLIGLWCAASVVTALGLGTFLRRRREATDPGGALRPLAVGPLDCWVAGAPAIPDTLAELDALDAPEPDGHAVPDPRPAADRVVRDPETVR